MTTITNIAAYKFATLSELKPLRERLADRCKAWKLKGTILLSTEGINLFVAGDQPEIDLLLNELRSVPGLEELEPKVSQSTDQPFRRMSRESIQSTDQLPSFQHVSSRSGSTRGGQSHCSTHVTITKSNSEHLKTP